MTAEAGKGDRDRQKSQKPRRERQRSRQGRQKPQGQRSSGERDEDPAGAAETTRQCTLQRRRHCPGKDGTARPAKTAQHHQQKRGRPANRQVCLNRSARRSYPFTRAWSARNWARPLSVSGCLSSPLMAASGQVATSAPASRQRMMWFVWRIEAASTCV